MQAYALTAADWALAAPLLWASGAAVLVLVLDALRPRPLLEAFLALAGLAGAAWSCLPLLAGETTGFGNGAGSSMLHATPALTALALLCFGAAFLAGVLGWRNLACYEGGRHATAFWSLLLITPVGMVVTLWAGHFATLFLGIETLSLPLYVLAALRRNEDDSIEAGLKYFLLGAFASGFLVFGMALLYAATGRMDPGAVAAAGDAGPLAVVGLGMLLVAVLFKLAAAPFHLWVADVYQGSPTPVTALMATGTKAAAAAALLRWAPGADLLGADGWAFLATLTLVVANLTALNQDNLKRLLALSGVAHVGILLYAFAARAAGVASAESWSILTYYLVAYGLAALTAFGALELLERHTGGSSDGAVLRGIARRQPFLGGLLALAILSLAGVPVTAGFLAKYFVFVGLLQGGLVAWAVAGVLLTLLSFGYYLRALVQLFMVEPPRARPVPVPEDSLAPVVLLVPAALTVVLGLWPGILPA